MWIIDPDTALFWGQIRFCQSGFSSCGYACGFSRDACCVVSWWVRAMSPKYWCISMLALGHFLFSHFAMRISLSVMSSHVVRWFGSCWSLSCISWLNQCHLSFKERCMVLEVIAVENSYLQFVSLSYCGLVCFCFVKQCVPLLPEL
jgi:hypothetical protein